MAQPTSPGALRTPRTRALEMGTESKGFTAMGPICPACGYPHTEGMPPHGEYRDTAADAIDGKAAAPSAHDTPFKLGGM